MRTHAFMRALAVGAALGAILATAPAGTPGAPQAAQAYAIIGDCTPGSDWGTLRQDLAARVVELVNQHRAALGLTQLQVTTPLTNSAVWKSRHMARYQYMAHNDPAPPVARSVGDRLLTCGYPANTSGWGENIAYGYTTPEAVMQGWLGSPGHRANIENASYRAIGVGAASSSAGRLYWTQQFGTSTAGSGPPPPPPPSYACSNGLDDDGDGKVDYPADPGCSSSTDTDEYDAPPPPPPPPPPVGGTVTAVPSSITVSSGTVRSGGVSSLSADDNAYFEVNSYRGVVLWWAGFNGVPNSLSTLKVTYRGLNSLTCSESLSLYNWQTAAWVTFASGSVGSSEVELSGSPAGALADYVSGVTGSGEVAVRFRCAAGSYFSYPSFYSSADLLKITYTS